MASVPTPHQFSVGEAVTSTNINTYYNGISFLENPPIAMIYQSGTGQTINSGSNTLVQFNATLVDTYGGHSNVTNNTRYTAQVAGWYYATGYVIYSLNSSGGRSVSLKKNGSDVQSSDAEVAPGSVFFTTLSTPPTLVFLNVGDYLEVNTDQNSGSSLTLVTGAPAGPSLTVFWVHA